MQEQNIERYLQRSVIYLKETADDNPDLPYMLNQALSALQEAVWDALELDKIEETEYIRERTHKYLTSR